MDGILVKYNDDGEPAGTAGSPMLKILLENGLSNVLIIVTRYFGGVLLGTGGLVRAYSQALTETLNKCSYINKTLGQEILIEVNYNELDNLKYYFNQKDIKVEEIEYLDTIKVIVEISENKLEEFTKSADLKTIKILKYEILNEKYIEI